MKNSKASALAVALSLMVLLTGLGVGALNYSGMQGQVIVNQKLSTQAFWLAEAGLQQSLANGGSSISSIPVTTFGGGTYLVNAVKNGNSVTLISTGTVSGSPTAKRTLQAAGTMVPLFNNAVIAGSSAASGVNLGSGVTIDNFNSNGSAGTGTGTIETNASGITGSNPAVGTVTTTAGVIFPTITPPALTKCPNGTTVNSYTNTPTNTPAQPLTAAWIIPNNTTYTFTGSGNYSCSYLQVGSDSTLIIDTNVVLYLTATDSATDPAAAPDPMKGEDLRGFAFTPPNSPNNGFSLGYVKILSGGSLTIYAAGRINTGNGDNQVPGASSSYYYSEALNNASFVDFLNQDLWDPDTSYPPVWNNTIVYKVGDLVDFNGKVWQSIKLGSGQQPATRSSFWTTNITIITYVTYNDEAWVSTNLSGNQAVNSQGITICPSCTPSASSPYWTLSTYSSSTTYPVNAYVTYNGGAWRSTVGANKGNTPGPSSPDWILSNNPIPADLIIYSLYTSPIAWSSTISYAIGDLVTYAGSAWQSILAGTDQPPSAGSLYWENIAWNSSTNYSAGSFVYYNGLIWQSVLAGSGNIPTAFSADLPANFTYYWNTYAGVEINNNTDHFYGLIYSPQSLVFLNLTETLSGSVVGNMVNIEHGSTVNYDQSLQGNTNLPTTFSLTNWKECSSATSC